MTVPHLRPSVGDWVLDLAWDVYAADGKHVGRIEEVHPHFLVVGKGIIFHRERYIPVSAITNVDGECVYLNVSSADIADRGWDRLPDTAAADAERSQTQAGALPESATAG